MTLVGEPLGEIGILLAPLRLTSPSSLCHLLVVLGCDSTGIPSIRAPARIFPLTALVIEILGQKLPLLPAVLIVALREQMADSGGDGDLTDAVPAALLPVIA